VIGNAAYQHAAPLRTPVADADKVSELLRKLDFAVVELKDVDKVGMEVALRRFTAEIDGADLALFYYSGHAAEVGETNYLVPVSAKIDGARSLALDTIALQDVSTAMREAGAKVQLLFLDACRDNPFESAFSPPASGGAARGLAPVNSASGALIAFSTRPGEVARDGTGENSPFTNGFLRWAAQPNLDIRQVLTRVRAQVLTETDNLQVPWDNSSLVGDVYLVPKRPPPRFEKLYTAVLGPDSAAQPLGAPAPAQPEGGPVEVTIEQAPTRGRLMLDSHAVLAGATISAADFARLAYEGAPDSPADVFSYRVTDAWGNNAVGAVTISRSAAGAAVAAARPPEPVPSLNIVASGVSLIGLGPNLIYRKPPAVMAASAARGVQLASDLPLGQIMLGDRVIDKGRSLDAADVARLKFVPAIGSTGKHLEARFVTADGSPGEVKVGIDVQMTDCDRLAGDRLDAQGVSEGVLTGHIDVATALPACELAHKAQPTSGRFGYQLGRVYAALGRDDNAMAAYRQAAASGYVRAEYALGYHYLYVPPVDAAQGKDWLEKAAAAGDVYATHMLGQMYYEGRGVAKDLAKARGLFETAARMGHTYSMNALGRMYKLGETVPVDLALARRYWEESASRGDIYGIDNLGFVYLEGVGAPKDPAKALTYFKQAADLGHPEAPRNIGILYFTGEGVPVDFEQARKWYLIGLERGDAWAAYNLGEMHRLGKGGAPDNAQAAYFYARAAAAINRVEPSNLARAELVKLNPKEKLAALRLLLRDINPSNASASEPELPALAQRAAAAKNLAPAGASPDALLIATAQALWLARNMRADLF
jgi:TPR repeat protein